MEVWTPVIRKDLRGQQQKPYSLLNFLTVSFYGFFFILAGSVSYSFMAHVYFRNE